MSNDYHITIDGVPKCSSPHNRDPRKLSAMSERWPYCGHRNRVDADRAAEMLRRYIPGHIIQVVEGICPMLMQ
jgi:hypothetical protein